jgi:hypothetical protein
MTINCHTFEDLVDDLALGLLTGIDRAAALTHAEECHSCRATLATLTEVADEMLLLAPSIAPDAGYEPRFVARIVAPAKGRAPRRRGRLAALAAAALVAITLAIVVVTGRVGSGTTTAVADMRTPAGAVVGTVSLHEGGSTFLDMRLPRWQALLRSYPASSQAHYWLELDARDGQHMRVPFDPVGDGAWHLETGAARGVTSVALIDEHGLVWCRARFA